MKDKDLKKTIGQLIKEKVEESGMTVTEFARKIHTSRRNVYEIFQKDSIDTSMLHNIARVLGSDWIVEYFIQKYQYKPSSSFQHTSNINTQEFYEYFIENKRTLNEIKALQHLILEILEKK